MGNGKDSSGGQNPQWMGEMRNFREREGKWQW